MPLRRRLSIIAAASVGIAILAAVGRLLRGRPQPAARRRSTTRCAPQAQAIENGGLAAAPAAAGRFRRAPAARPRTRRSYCRTAESRQRPGQPRRCRSIGADRAIADGKGSGTYLADVHGRQQPPARADLPGPHRTDGHAVAVQLARPLNSVDSVLSRPAADPRCSCCSAACSSPARSAGWPAAACSSRSSEVAARRAAHRRDRRPVRRLHVHADDEVGRLATRFNAMLDRLQGSRNALDESVRAQRQLVADASHELRTPVTSLRTNIEILLQTGELDPEERRRDARPTWSSSPRSWRAGQRPDRARPRRPAGRRDRRRPPGPGGRGVAGAGPAQRPRAARSRRTIEPALLDGVPERLGRAINNLLDNASRHSPPGGTIELLRRPGRGPRPRPRHGRRPRPTCPTCSTASTAAPTRAGARARTGPGDRAPGHRAARRHRVGRQRPRTAARCSRWRSPRSRPDRPARRTCPRGPEPGPGPTR